MSLTTARAATFGKVARHLLPLLFICYVVCYLDRVNVGFAKLQMARDLHFSDAVYGFGAGIFFISYFLFEMPSNMVLYRVGARRWLARIMITWAAVSAATMFVRTPGEFYGVRFLLGITEAGFFPGVLFTLTRWFPSDRRGRMIALFMAGNPVAGVIGSPVSGTIMQHMGGIAGLAGWQWLFLLEAAPAVLLALVLLRRLPDGIDDAAFLDAGEKEQVRQALGGPARDDGPPLGAMLRDRRVWLGAALNFCLVVGQYGVGFWLPTMIHALGVRSLAGVGWLTAIPYATAILAMVLVAGSADRRRERRWHVAIPALVAAVAFVASTFVTSSLVAEMLILSIATAGVTTTLPLFWGVPTSFLRGASGAAGLALVNATGALAGFFSPYAIGWLNDATHDLRAGVYTLAAALVLGSLLVLRFRAAEVNA